MFIRTYRLARVNNISISSYCRGQLTAGGVPAVDFAWHVLIDNKTGFVLNVKEIATTKDNITPSLWYALHNLTTVGYCWVSVSTQDNYSCEYQTTAVTN